MGRHVDPQRDFQMGQVAGLRTAGKSNKEISKILEIPYGKVARYASQLIGEGKIEAHARGPSVGDIDPQRKFQMDQVERLRIAGKTNEEISKILGIPYWKAANLAAQLIHEGKIEAHDRGTPVGDIDKEIISLRERGYTKKRIAKVLEVSVSTVGRRITALSKEGKLPRKEKGWNKKPPKPYKIHVFQPDEPFWTTTQAAKELKVGHQFIAKLCIAKKVPGVIETNTVPKYLLTTESMDYLKTRPRIKKRLEIA